MKKLHCTKQFLDWLIANYQHTKRDIIMHLIFHTKSC